MEKKQSKRIDKSLKHNTKLSKRYYKEQIKINKIHKKNKDIKMFELHKISNNVIDYLKKKRINQSGFSIFINLISYKCKQFGIVVKKINPKYSSKLFSNCSYCNHSLKFEKKWFCSKCGMYHDRDINVAINIFEEDKLFKIQKIYINKG